LKGLFKLFILAAILFCVSSIFKGGDYIRFIGSKTGVYLPSVAALADSLRLDSFIAQRKSHEQQKEESKLAN